MSIRTVIERLCNSLWYGRSALRFFLLPLSGLFRSLVYLRRKAYQFGLFSSYRASIPVIVVGNINIGGTGKTPLVIWLAQFLLSLGYKPAVICNGYKGHAKKWPQQVRPDSDPFAVGDEAVLIARNTQNISVVASPDRALAIRSICEHSDCNIIIADDALQHYALERDIEIAVVHGVRRFGNGLCLPAGPLREPISRMAEVDITVTNGLACRGEFAMKVKPDALCNLRDKTRMPLDQLKGVHIHAVAGIGNPDSFFILLKSLGAVLEEHIFSDHHQYKANDIIFDNSNIIVMTEKDAVKCERFAAAQCWYLPVSITVDARLETRLKMLVERI